VRDFFDTINKEIKGPFENPDPEKKDLPDFCRYWTVSLCHSITVKLRHVLTGCCIRNRGMELQSSTSSSQYRILTLPPHPQIQHSRDLSIGSNRLTLIWRDRRRMHPSATRRVCFVAKVDQSAPEKQCKPFLSLNRQTLVTNKDL
jgi:hypothetical protein